MKASVSKKISSLVLALAVMFTTVFAAGVPVQAATVKSFKKVSVADKDISLKGETTTLADKYGTANAGEEIQIPFTLNQASPISILVAVKQPTATRTALYQGGSLVPEENGNNPCEYSASDYVDLSSVGVNGYGINDGWETDMPAGDYTYSCTFADSVDYEIVIGVAVEEAKISQEKATITKGFTKKLSVSGGKVSKWSSSKKSVATVDSKGKVTAKKKGNATITATLEDGTKLKCKITVKDNKYTGRKITTSDVALNAYGMDAYSASFDKKGNLVVKISIANNSYGRMTKIPGFKVTVKNQNGKKVGSYSKSSFKVNVGSYSQKTYTVTIKKSSKLSAKKVDLRNSEITVDGGTATVYY